MSTSMTESPESNPSKVLDNNTIDSWKDLSKLVAHFSKYNGHDWLFRGVTSVTYKLIPKVGRPERKPKPTSANSERRINYSFPDEVAVFEMFKDAARAHVSANPTNELEWLALAQHFGVSTRLLDWTEGFLMAAWFAVKKSGFVEAVDEHSGKITRKSHDAAIWVTRNLERVGDSCKKQPLKAAGIKCYRPPHISPRIPSQRSVFTLHGNPTEEAQLSTLVQFIIPSKRCFEFRKRLDACGVNQNSLFPDLEGLGSHLAWRYKNNWLAGYR